VTERVSPTGRIHADIDDLFSSEGDLGETLEEVARLGARLLLQSALEAEVTEFLGRGRYQRRALAREARAGSRNGFAPFTVKTTAGPITLERPKLRGTDQAFASRLLGAGVTRTNALESLVIAGFVRGLSVRDVEAALAEALGPGATVSRSTVSRICQAIKDEFDAFKQADLSGIECEYLFIGGAHFKMHAGAGAEPVLVAWGFDVTGKPHLLGLEPGSSESTDAWADFLRGMAGRGLRPPLLVISDRRARPHRRGGGRAVGEPAPALSDPPRPEPPGQGAQARPGEGQGGVLGHLRWDRGGAGGPGRGGGHPQGQGLRRQVGQAVPGGGGLSHGGSRSPHHLPAVPP